jgi:hypothetical protein
MLQVRVSLCIFIDGQVCLVHLQVDTANGQTTNFHLHNEQMVNGVRKIAWAFLFPFDFLL